MSHVEALEEMGIMRDVEYQELDLGAMINLQPLQEDHNHVEHTPNMDQHVNEAPQQRSPGIRNSCPPSLPQLSTVRKMTPRRIHVDESCLSDLEGKLPKRTIDCQCSKLMKEYFESKGDGGNRGWIDDSSTALIS